MKKKEGSMPAARNGLNFHDKQETVYGFQTAKRAFAPHHRHPAALEVYEDHQEVEFDDDGPPTNFPRRARTALRKRGGDAWVESAKKPRAVGYRSRPRPSYEATTIETEQEVEVAEALFDLANMFAKQAAPAPSDEHYAGAERDNSSGAGSSSQELSPSASPKHKPKRFRTKTKLPHPPENSVRSKARNETVSPSGFVAPASEDLKRPAPAAGPSRDQQGPEREALARVKGEPSDNAAGPHWEDARNYPHPAPTHTLAAPKAIKPGNNGFPGIPGLPPSSRASSPSGFRLPGQGLTGYLNQSAAQSMQGYSKPSWPPTSHGGGEQEVSKLMGKLSNHPGAPVPPNLLRKPWKRCASHVYIAHFIDYQQQLQRFRQHAGQSSQAGEGREALPREPAPQPAAPPPPPIQPAVSNQRKMAMAGPPEPPPQQPNNLLPMHHSEALPPLPLPLAHALAASAAASRPPISQQMPPPNPSSLPPHYPHLQSQLAMMQSGGGGGFPFLPGQFGPSAFGGLTPQQAALAAAMPFLNPPAFPPLPSGPFAAPGSLQAHLAATSGAPKMELKDALGHHPEAGMPQQLPDYLLKHQQEEGAKFSPGLFAAAAAAAAAQQDPLYRIRASMAQGPMDPRPMLGGNLRIPEHLMAAVRGDHKDDNRLPGMPVFR